MTSLLRTIGFSDSPDGALGIVMSALAGIAAALAVAIVLSVYFRSSYRSRHDLLKHGLTASAVLVLVAFAISDMRQAALAYLGLNPAKPAVEFEIRLPKATLTTAADTQVELLDRPEPETGKGSGGAGLNRRRPQPVAGNGDARLPHHRARDRAEPARPAQSTFRLRLPASPSRSGQFGPWHLADGIVPVNGI